MDVFPTLFLDITENSDPFLNEMVSSAKDRKDFIQIESIMH